MQDAVIAMAIIVVLLALWRLHSHPRQLGWIGPWATTNIFGPATLGLLPGPGPSGDGDRPAPGIAGGSGADSNTPSWTQSNVASNAPSASETNPVAVAPSGQPSPAEPPAAPEPPLSTNLLNTNGPVTLIAVTPSELEPPGVISRSAMAGRLRDAGAKGGDIQISLFWENFNDLDLHCIDLKGEEIFFSNRISSRTHGELDVDRNASEPYTNKPVENIYWPVGGAPPGLYRVSVVHFANHGGAADPTPFTVRTVIKGQTNLFNSKISYATGRVPQPVCSWQYDPNNADPSNQVRFVFGRPVTVSSP